MSASGPQGLCRNMVEALVAAQVQFPSYRRPNTLILTNAEGMMLLRLLHCLREFTLFNPFHG